MDKDLTYLQKKLKGVGGFLRDDEARLLYKLAKKSMGKGVIVEIGSWMGKSTICLALGSKHGPKSMVYAVDPHIGSAEHQRTFGSVNTLKAFKKNIKKSGVAPFVKPLVTTSQKAARTLRQPVELIFIDGNHDYQVVKKDFLNWFPNVINEGIMAFHDTVTWPGPKKVVEKFLFKSPHFKNIHLVGSITFAQKTNQNSFLDRIFNRYVLLLKCIREKILKIGLPKPLHQLTKKIYYYIQ